MANLTIDQINELKDKGVITQVIPSAALADNSVDDLKEYNLVTLTDPSEDIEEAASEPESQYDIIGILDDNFIEISSYGYDPSGELIDEVGTITWNTNDSLGYSKQLFAKGFIWEDPDEDPEIVDIPDAVWNYDEENLTINDGWVSVKSMGASYNGEISVSTGGLTVKLNVAANPQK